jgi:hypothetical protein
MKTLFATLLLFLAGTVFGQSLGMGGVAAVRPIPPCCIAYDFLLFAGGPAEGFIGNGFAYEDGRFDLAFKGAPFCTNGCTFNGDITTWFAPQALPDGCRIQSALLDNGALYIEGKYLTGLKATYSQLFCTTAGNWGSGGTLTVHLQ